MEKSEDAKDGRKPGWDTDHADYACADGVAVYLRNDAQRNGLRLESGVERARVLVSGLETSRDMARIVRGAESAKEVMFPRSVRTVARGAFWRNKALRQVVANEGLKELEKNPNVSHWCSGPFSYSQIERIRLPSTLRRLKDCALAQCYHLKNVTLVEGLEEIGDSCFASCDMQRLVIPSSVRVIGERVANDCKNLKIITFAENSQLEKVEDNSFVSDALSVIFVMPGMRFELEKYAKDIPVVRMPSLDTLVGDCVLRQLRGVKVVQLPEGLETIGEGWFADSWIERAVVPASVRELQRWAFACCCRLKQVEFAEGSRLEKIGEYCFFRSALECMAVPGGVRRIEGNAFANCSSLRNVTFQEDSVLEEIGARAFYMSGLKTFSTPSSLRSIREEALRVCWMLESAELREGLEDIGEDCLSDTKLKNVVFPMSLKKLGRYFAYRRDGITINVSDATEMRFIGSSITLWPRGDVRISGRSLSELRELQTVEFPDGLERVGNGWFRGGKIKEVVVPASVREIGSHAFDDCLYLCSVTFQAGSRLETLGGFAFQQCFQLQCLELPNTTRRIGESCFSSSGLKTFTVPEGVTDLEEEVFWGCKHLRRVIMDNYQRTIRTDCFAYSEVEEVVLPKGLQRIEGYAFHNCKRLRRLAGDESKLQSLDGAVFPKSLREIGESAFDYCPSLSHVILNEGLEVLGKCAFSGCGLRSVKVPRALKAQANQAFKCCKQIVSIEFAEESALETVGGGAFFQAQPQPANVSSAAGARVSELAFNDRE